jgi:Flp pilus assembly protein TadD
VNLGLAEEQKGNPGEAILHYRDALRLNPLDAQAQSSLKRLTASPTPTIGR